MNWSAGRTGTINQRAGQANGLSAPPIGCGLHLLGLPGGGNKIYDRSPYGNIGTITGAVWVRLSSGLWCLSFDGSDDYVDLGNIGTFSDLTIKLWLYMSGRVDSWRGIFGRPANAAAYGCLAIRDSNTLGFYMNGNSPEWTYANTSWDSSMLNAWHQVAVTYSTSGKKCLIYLNADEDANQAITTAQSCILNLVNLGRALTTDRWWQGYIALPEVHNRALSALEIQTSFKREKHLFGVW